MGESVSRLCLVVEIGGHLFAKVPAMIERINGLANAGLLPSPVGVFDLCMRFICRSSPGGREWLFCCERHIANAPWVAAVTDGKPTHVLHKVLGGGRELPCCTLYLR